MSNRDILKNGLKNLGISVDDKMLNDFNIYREILVDWNQKMNLTGIEDEKEVDGIYPGIPSGLITLGRLQRGDNFPA